ncbi:MAG: alpha/beta fold hydrolase [Thermoleophilaceae bacterium]
MTGSAFTFPPTMARHLFESAVETWRAGTTATIDYWSGAIARGATPQAIATDALRWYAIASDRREPTWASPNQVVLDADIARLRDFSQGSRASVVPTLVLPPQAGHHSCIVDYSRSQSQMEVIRAAGLERAFAMEWVGATRETRERKVTDYLAFLEQAIDRIGAPVNLIGDCQGGWLAMIYAALHPDQVNTLTLAGAPIDFHAGQGIIHEWVKLLCQTGDMSFYEAMVAAGGGVMKGSFILDGFIAIKPESEVAKQLGLLSSLDDNRHRERYGEFEDWFKHTQDLPGSFYLWIVEHLFRDNELIDGRLRIGGNRVELSRFDRPLNLLAGETDHITPPDQVFAAARAVATAPDQVTRRTTSGGHLGLFMGREALREHWPPILADVLGHSRKRARRATSQQRARERTPASGKTIPAP